MKIYFKKNQKQGSKNWNNRPYVGLPLMLRFNESGLMLLVLNDEDKVNVLNSG